jgi:hypothetical protein
MAQQAGMAKPSQRRATGWQRAWRRHVVPLHARKLRYRQSFLSETRDRSEVFNRT